MGSNVNVDDLGEILLLLKAKINDLENKMIDNIYTRRTNRRTKIKDVDEDINTYINNYLYDKNPAYEKAYEQRQFSKSLGLTHFDMDFSKVFELLNKHLKNLSGRITEEEKVLTNYDSHLQTENFNSQLKNKEDSLINLALEMLTIQSKMISNISNRQTERQTEIKGAYKQHMLAEANNETFYDYFEEQRNDFTFG
jgi:hypothetical protein